MTHPPFLAEAVSVNWLLAYCLHCTCSKADPVLMDLGLNLSPGTCFPSNISNSLEPVLPICKIDMSALKGGFKDEK